MNILHICPDLQITCGRTRYLTSILNSFPRENCKLFLVSNQINNERYKIPPDVIFKEIKISTQDRNLFSFLSATKSLRKFILVNKIDVIHTHHRYAEFVTYFTKRLYFLKFIIVSTIHSITYKKYPFQHKANKLIAVSNFVKEHLINYHKVCKNKISVIYNFVDASFFNIQEFQFSRHNEYILFSAGRFHKEKNFICLLKAIRMLNDLNLKLLIIGEGDQKPIYEGYIRDNDLEGKVKLLNPIPDISKYYIDSDICILPSLSETLGFFILEAGLFSKTVIASNIGGVKEIIDNDINGLLFESDNEEDLANNIRKALSDIELRHRLGKNLNLKILNKFNKIIHIQKLSTIYVESRTDF